MTMTTLALVLVAALAGAQDEPGLAGAQDKPGLTPPGFNPPGQSAKLELKAVRPEQKGVTAGEPFKVAFDLVVPAGWYTYPTYKKGIGAPTKFTFENAVITGKVEEPKAKTKAGTEIIPEYDYHIGAVTMTVPLTVNAEGPVTVKGQIDYQVCNPKTCIPGKIPFEFEVQVAPGDDDGPPPGEILSAVPRKTDVKAGEVFIVDITLKIPDGWHIYPTYKTNTGDLTKFTFPGLEVAGKIEEPKTKIKPKGEIEPEYEYHEGTVTFGVPFKLLPGPKPGKFEVAGAIEYLICDPTTCIPGDAKTKFDINVLEGGEEVAAVGSGANPTFMLSLGLAFLGGLLLNVMPCVLPVLLLKVMSLVKQKNISTGERHAAALAYTGGVLICFEALAVVVIILSIGWGGQFQFPGFVIGLTTLIYVMALSLLGVFELPAVGTGAAAQAGQKKGWMGHLMTGFFVTLVATPCSAPFLGTGMGFAFTLPPWGIFLFFTVAGLGLAFPFLIIGFVPALFKLLPKPGPWLEVFKKLMGFALIATAVWLVDTVASLTGQAGVIGFLAFLTFVSIGAWIYGTWGKSTASGQSRLVSIVAAVALSVLGGVWFLETKIAETKPGVAGFQTEDLDFSGKIPWQAFSDENVEKLRVAGKPGFIDFTADW